MKPILFNTEMVQAILDGRKTQTRRVLGMDATKYDFDCTYPDTNGALLNMLSTKNPRAYPSIEVKAKYKKGDTLYVRETFLDDYAIGGQYDDGEAINVIYRADKDDKGTYQSWKPSIHMPKEYARIFLKVTNVRVERLQDISNVEIEYEGSPHYADMVNTFALSGQENIENMGWWVKLWNSTSKDGYKWEDNPYVFVYEFERVEHE